MAKQLRRRTDGARILVVEDSEDFSLLMQLALQDAGYVVDCAMCAEDALRMMKTQRYRLLLSDYSLPGYGAGVRVLMITGDPDAPGVRDFTRVVPKPVNFDRFLAEIRLVLESSGQSAASDLAA